MKLVPHEKMPEKIPQDLSINVLYEDLEMIGLNKNAGMVVHPATSNSGGTIVNGFAFYLSKKVPLDRETVLLRVVLFWWIIAVRLK